MRECGWLVFGGLFFFIVSLMLFYQVPPTKNHQDIDSGAYVQAANFLLEDGSFKRIHSVPYYGLGYPVFLAGMKKLGGDTIGFIVAIQVFLAWLITLLVWKMTDQLFGRRAAWAAYLLALTNIGLLVFAQFLLTEIVLVLLLTLFIERFITFLSNKNLRTLASCGLFLGLSCIIKTVGLLFVGPLVVFVGIFSVRTSRYDCFAITRGEREGDLSGVTHPSSQEQSDAFFSIHRLSRVFRVAKCIERHIRTSLKNIAVLLIAFAMPYGLYQWHNKAMFVENVHSMNSLVLYYWYYPYLRAQINGTTSDEEKIFVRQQVSYQELPAMLRRDVLAHPGKACIALGKNWIKTLLGLYTSNVKLLVDNQFVSGSLSFFNLEGSLWQRLWGYITGKTEHAWISVLGVVEAGLLLLRYVLVPWGIWALYRRQRWFELTFLVLYVGYFVGITGHDGCARFRLMIDMVVLVLAGGGFAALNKSLMLKFGALRQ